MHGPQPAAGRRALLAAAFVVFAALMLLQPLPRSVGEPLAWAVQSITVLYAASAMMRRGRQVRGRLRRARMLVAASLLAGALGGVASIVWLLVTGEPPPDPAVTDLIHFCFVPLVAAGLLSYPVRRDHPGSSSRALLDGLVAAGALWFVAYTLLLAPASVGTGLPLGAQLVALGYPAADVFVLGLLASVLPRVHPSARRELAVTGLGLALYAVADLAYCVLAANGTYRADSWKSLVGEVGLLLIAAGTTCQGTRDMRAPRWLSLTPALPVAAAIAVAGGIVLSGDGIEGSQLVAGLVLVAALFLRQQVSERDRDELMVRLQERERLFRSLVAGASDLITLHAADGTLTWVSPTVERIAGRPWRELLGTSIGDLVEPQDRHRLRRAFVRVAGTPGGQGECTVRLRSATGDWRWMQVLLDNRLDDPSVGGIILNTRDVHERHLLERRLSHAAFHDTLTGLGNLAQARALLDRCYSPRHAAAVVLVDLDGFKAVNDTFGHAHGDALLRAVAERLSACLRSGDEVCRIGGDEFVIVLDGEHEVGVVAERVLHSVRQPLHIAGTSLTVGASLGIALTADAASPDEVLRNADLAMYASKSAGRDRVTWYEPWMHESAARRMALHRGLRPALEQGHFSLQYQPIVRLPDGTLVGAEALLRWDDPEQGPIAPEEFIPVAEESGLIGEIDLWVLDRACEDVAAWRAAGFDVPPLSINVSRRHMTLDLPEVVAQALARHSLPGSALCLEITESAVVPDAEAASVALSLVRALGVAVALDDFGSGESSLSQLARLPLDSVKIDRSFTQTAGSDAVALRLLTSIVGVCKALSLPVVAEGVEEGELVGFLAGIGCDRGQGWYFGHPQPAVDFRRRLATRTLPRQRGGTPGEVVVQG